MLAERLFDLASFQEQYNRVLVLSVSLTIEKLIWNQDRAIIENKINWNNLLSISSVLCLSDNNEHLEASLRIAQTVLQIDTLDEQKAASIYILQKLTNIPSYELAIKRELINKDLINRLPLSLKFEINQTKIFNSININENIISLNKFQKKVYEKSKVNESLSISAPTSAGKSFILYQLLLEKINKVNNIIYLVPTRALISQVEHDLNTLANQYQISNITITSVPKNEELNSTIFVLTQERLHRLYIDNPAFITDFILVDEAHKIDNGNRGILLERKLEEIIQINPNVEIFFSSPFTSNPEILLDIVKNKIIKEVINTEFVAVNQNLIYVTQEKGKTTKWNLSLVTKSNSYPLGYINLAKDKRPTTETKKVGYLAYELGSNNGGNIIYANGAAQAEDYAKILSLLYENEDKRKTADGLKNLIKLVKRSIHRNYILSKLLNSKISIHYGNLPLLIRQEIEKLFKTNDIKYLVCTSTLLEGMNLPAKSIFIRKPSRGNNKPLNENDFWNLAGRAGRWGKEFSGNIFCIEPQLWEIKPNPQKKKQLITKALDELNKNEQLSFLDYIKKGSPREEAEKNQHFEFAFNYYYSLYLNDNLSGENNFKIELNSLFDTLKKKIRVPKSIIERNPGISPIAQQELLEYFENYSKDINNLIPVYPEDENSYKEYISLISRIGKTLAKFNHKLSSYRSILILNWINGQPLSRLIADSIKHYEQKGEKRTVDSVCREVMAEVENFVRFRFVKESSCYIDILKFFLQERKEFDLIDNIPDLSLWLEFGVSEETQISLLAIGFSRQTAIILSELIVNSDLNKFEVIKWLIDMQLDNYDISPIVKTEIYQIRKRYSIESN